MKNTLKKVAGNWILDINNKVFINPSPKVIIKQLKQSNQKIVVRI